MAYKILIIEDNTLLVQTLEDFLTEHAYECTLVTSAKEAMEQCYRTVFDLYLLDVKLPDMSGFEVLQALRHSKDYTPTIFITSLEDQESVAKGFLAGGDDYIKKPFDLNELLLRIKAILARTKGGLDDWLEIDGVYKLNLSRKRLFRNNEELDLHLKDFELLHLLIKERGRVVTKEMIYEKLWSSCEEINEGSIRVYINNLKKIFGKDAICNLRGIGYRFEK